MVFTAANYDVLVDAPTEMGKFDVTKYEVDGKPHYFVANPAGTFSQEKADKFVEMMAKVAKAGSAMFGGLPYEKYIHFYFFASPESNASGALEHLNSFVSFAPPGDQRHGRGNYRHGLTRVFPPLERQTDPPGRDVAVRLFA